MALDELSPDDLVSVRSIVPNLPPIIFRSLELEKYLAFGSPGVAIKSPPETSWPSPLLKKSGIMIEEFGAGGQNGDTKWSTERWDYI